MILPALFEALRIPLTSTAFLEGWDESMATLPARDWECITANYVEPWCERLSMATDAKAALLDGLRLFDDRPELIALAWHGHRLLCRAGAGGIHTAYGFPVYGFPALDTVIHPAAPLLQAYCCLATVPCLRALHAERGIEASITWATLDDIQIWMKTTFEREGHWGCNKIGWFTNHFAGKLYRLGRLQFEIRTHQGIYRAYRHNATGETVTVVARETRFRQDGQVDGCNGVNDPQAWTSVFEESSNCIRATPIDPHGHALPMPVTLDLAEWNCILKEGDICLGVHIPAAGGMEHGDCAASFAAAIPFFSRHFPELEIKAFTCTSWLLDNQFCAILPPRSNIVRFLREWYLAPNPGGSDAQALDRIFGGPIADLDTAPQDTSLQRAVVAHMKAGKRCRDSAAFFFPHSLPWGHEAYRKDR